MMIFILIWSIWFSSEILLNILFRSGNLDKKDQDKGTIRVIWITIGVANSLGIIFVILLKIPISNLFIIPYSGLFLIIFGMIFRFISMWTLGKFFTVHVTIRANHKIKQDGVYKLIRHPAYLGSILSFIGYGISLNNLVSLIVISIPVTMVMLYRIKIEEKLLLDHFGAEYLDYIKRTYRLIPWIY